ncbi:Histidine kinase 1 [Hibiscus syriacus]|uniref:histidine kinase n=1 Tax=Hibiscus syriacus TaxID=106335 RepID=A0A6A2ZP31_HIBSY|nr:Histidine kinase 1 [Hibiscus syriacus]
MNTLAYGLRYELLQRPILRMWNILNSTSEITTAQVKVSEYVIRRYSKPTNQAEQIELYQMMKDITWALFASRKALNAITINYRNGFVQAFHRDHRSNNTFYIYSNLANYSISDTESYDNKMQSSRQGWNDQFIHGNVSAIWYRQPLDPVTGEKKGKPSQIPPEDLINIAGPSQVPDGVASWHVAVSKYTDSPLLSAALRGYIYLTSQEGYLLATSTNTHLLNNTAKGPKLMMAVNSEDRVIRMGAQWLQKTYGNKFPLVMWFMWRRPILGANITTLIHFLNLKRLPIVGVIIIPRKYIMGKVDERALKTLVILISASVCILVIGCVCILILTNGVSKEMKLRAELISHLDARRRAEASSNYKSQFLANMSHELRTPMAAVIGLLDILICDDCLTNEQYAMVTQIRKCSTALLRLLNNILDLSKVESGKLVLEEAEFDLGRELEGLVDMFSVQCINHNVETVLDLSDDIPKVVRGDSARVVQVFANLISNSIKFTTSGHIILRGWCENPNVPRIDKCKWESVFESFEQADPSTTRTHGGTGLGLCIVRTLVNKMGGEIKVVKKNGKGTLMRLFLLLSTPADGIEQERIDFAKHSVAVILALHGSMGRLIMSNWLSKNGVPTLEASEWNELTQILHELFHAITTNSVVDLELLDLSTNIWKEQLNFLDKFSGQVKFVWMLNHDTSNAIKMEIRRKGHIDAQTRSPNGTKGTSKQGDSHECLEIDSTQFETCSSDESDISDMTGANSVSSVRIGEQPKEGTVLKSGLSCITKDVKCENPDSSEQPSVRSNAKDRDDIYTTNKAANEQKSLQGLRILLAEDTPVLQRVATIMLEKMGAVVVAVGDGVQAVEALNCMPDGDEYRTNTLQTEICDSPPYDLILMDCQMPMMDGYEATKAIRKSEEKTGWHIPIVALTAHAMSSDKEKCLEVGMDAYLTKPVDYKLMVSTILSLTKRSADQRLTQ